MRHNRSINHLGRKSGHRKAMLANMASSLILSKRIETTVDKAKALKSYVEPLITKSKEDTTADVAVAPAKEPEKKTSTRRSGAKKAAAPAAEAAEGEKKPAVKKAAPKSTGKAATKAPAKKVSAPRKAGGK